MDCSTLPHHNLKIEDANFSRIRLMTWKYAMRCRVVRWNFHFLSECPSLHCTWYMPQCWMSVRNPEGRCYWSLKTFRETQISGKELCRGKLLASILSEPLQDIASFHLKLLCILSHGKAARFGLTRSWVRTNLRHLVIERPRFRYYPYRDPLGLFSKLYSALPNMPAQEEINIPKMECHGQAIMRKP